MKHIVKKDDLRTEVKQASVYGCLTTLTNFRDALDGLFGDYIDTAIEEEEDGHGTLYMKVNYVEPDKMTQAIEKLIELSEQMEHNRNVRFIEEYRRRHGEV